MADDKSQQPIPQNQPAKPAPSQSQSSQSQNEQQSNAEFKFSNYELDALKETANIGTGNASIALSNILKKKVDISLPETQVLDTHSVAKMIGGPKEMIVCIFSKIKEGMEGNIALLLPLESARQLANVFQEGDAGAGENLSEDDKLILKKVGSALYASFLTSLAKFFEQRITFLPPSVTSTFGDSIVDFILLRVTHGEKVFVIKVGFSIDSGALKGDFILLFTLNSLAPLMQKIKDKSK